MKVVYPGDMAGYHVIGRRGVALRPGVNEVEAGLGHALIEEEIVIPIEETHLRETPAESAVEEPDFPGLEELEPVDETPTERESKPRKRRRTKKEEAG